MAELSRDIGPQEAREVSSLPSCGDLQVKGTLKSMKSGEEHAVTDLTECVETRTSLGSLDLAQTASQVHRYTRGEIFSPYLHLAMPKYGPGIPAPGVTHRGRTVTANSISCQAAKEAIEARGFMETFMSFDYNALPSVCAFMRHLKENVTPEIVAKYQKEILAKHPTLPREEAGNRAHSKALLEAFHSFTLDSSQDVLHTLGSQCIGLSEAMGQALSAIGLKGYSVVERRDATSPPQHAALVVPCEDGVLLVDLAPPRLLILKPNEEALTVQPGEGTDKIQTGFKVVEVENDYGVKAPMIVKSETITDAVTGEVRHKEQTQFLLRSIARPEIPAMTRYLVNQAIYPLVTKAKSNGDILRLRFSFDTGEVSFDRFNERHPKESYQTVKIPFSLVDQRTGTIDFITLISKEKDPEKREALKQTLRDIFGSDTTIEGFWQEFEAPEQIRGQVFTLASQENLRMMQDLFVQVKAVHLLTAKGRGGHEEIRMKINLRTDRVSMERGEGASLRKVDIPFHLFDPATRTIDLSREEDSEKRQRIESQLQKFLVAEGKIEDFWEEFQEPNQIQDKIFSFIAQKRPPQSRPVSPAPTAPALHPKAVITRAVEQFRRLHETRVQNNLTDRIAYAAMQHHESTIQEYVTLLNSSLPGRKMWTDEPVLLKRSQAIQQGNIMSFLISMGQTPSIPGDSLDRSHEHQEGICQIVRGLTPEVKTIIKNFLENPKNLEKIGLSREHPMYRAVITEMVIERASSLLGVDAQEIRHQVNTHPAALAHAFEAKVVIVEFPGLQVDEDTARDDIPPFTADMTLREKFLLGTIAQLCGKTKFLESRCIEKGQERRGSYEMVTIDSASGPRQLEILCHGELKRDSTCVLMEGGRGESAEAWEKTMDQLPSNTFAVSYSRAGEGLSDKAPDAGLTDQTPDSGSMDKALQDFSALVSKLEMDGRIHKPYILVGHSLGGLLMQAYANLHPGDIKGLVLVDSASDVQKPENYPVSPSHPDLMPPSTEELLFPSSVTMVHETKLIRDSQAELRQRPKLSPEKLLGDLPIHVLSSKDTEADPEWRKGQEALRQLSSHVTSITAPEGVGHDIQRKAPQLVAQAIQRMGAIDWGPSERAYLPNLKHQVAEYLAVGAIDPSQVKGELRDHLPHGEELVESIDKAIQDKSIDQFLALLEPVSEGWLSDFIKGLNLPIQARLNVPPTTFTFTEKSLQELDAYIHDPATGFSGVVTIQDQRGRYTIASTGVDPQAIFSMHSIGKVFTGVLTFRLIQAGVISEEILRAPLGKVLAPDVLASLPRNVQEHIRTNQPTLLEVMQHKGGLGNYLTNYFKKVEEERRLGREPPKMERPENLLRFANEETFPRGEYHYSNLGILLVGLSLQHITGKSFDKLLNEYVTAPAHMECFSSQKPSRALINPDDPTSAYNFGSPAGGYWTTAQDLCSFGSWLSSLWKTEPRFKELVERYGEEFYPREGEIWHNGAIDSASADFSVFLDHGVVLSVMSNKADQAMEMNKAIKLHMLQH